MSWKNRAINRIKNLKYFPYFTKDPFELEYFLGYDGSNGYLLALNPEEFYFFTDGRYYELYKQYYPENIGLITGEKKLSRWIKEKMLNKKTLYFSSDQLLYSEYLGYKKDFKPCLLKQINQNTKEIRMIKSREEIETVKKAICLTEEGLAYIISYIKEGMTEKQTAAELEYYLRLKGADNIAFPTIVLFGENSAYPHGKPGDRKLKEGDVVLIDLGIKIDHYCSDMTRTFCYRSAPENFAHDYEFVLKIQKEAIKEIKPEIKAYLLDNSLRKKMQKEGVLEYYSHSLGHGVGVEIHEAPYLSFLRKKEILSKGTLFTIEPGIYKPGKYGIRIEDMVYIDPRGKIEVLTDFTKELLIKTN